MKLTSSDTMAVGRSASSNRTRRDLTRYLGWLALGGVLGLPKVQPVAARKKQRKKRKRKAPGRSHAPQPDMRCVPQTDTMACQGMSCGVVTDGCGTPHRCGTCTGGAVCTSTGGGTCDSSENCDRARRGPGQNLSGRDLTGCHLTNANLKGSNLARANLSGAVLAGADLAMSNLQQANLSGATLRGATLRAANLAGVIWSNTTCPDGSNSDDHPGATCRDNLTP